MATSPTKRRWRDRVQELIFPIVSVQEIEIESGRSVICLPEGDYECDASIFLRKCKRKRWPFPALGPRMARFRPDPEIKTPGPGKLPNTRTTWSLSQICFVQPEGDIQVASVVAKGIVMQSRQTYGHVE